LALILKSFWHLKIEAGYCKSNCIQFIHLKKQKNNAQEVSEIWNINGHLLDLASIPPLFPDS
jgi:hypothetical protein